MSRIGIKPKYSTRDAHAGPWTTCDRCGLIDNLSRMQFQYDFLGGSTPQNLHLLHCSRCMDDLNYQRKLIIIPPDPPPIFNTRPENYVVDETNWLTTDDGSILTTDDGVPFITSEPNPADSASASQLLAELVYPAGSVGVAYLDLFDGNPLTTGTSILLPISGSATRTDVSASLTTASGIAQNTSPLTIVSSSLATINVSYIGIYSSASGGVPLVSGPVAASPSITLGSAVQFPSLGLSININ